MKIELEPEQLTALIEHLGALTIRYEMEASAYASVGTTGQALAEERLEAAREVGALREYLFHK